MFVRPAVAVSVSQGGHAPVQHEESHNGEGRGEALPDHAGVAMSDGGQWGEEGGRLTLLQRREESGGSGCHPLGCPRPDSQEPESYKTNIFS